MSGAGDYALYGSESYVFRDGRPFGEASMARGGMLRWPLPSTLAGMLRSRYGEDLGMDFRSAEEIARLKAIRLARVQPLHRVGGVWSPLHPRPADAVVIDREREGERLVIHRATFTGVSEGCGTDADEMLGGEWLLPRVDANAKPSSRAPELWHWEQFERWLLEEEMPALTANELGLPGATPAVRMHTAIDPATGTVAEGQLFMSQGVRFGVRAPGSSDAAIEMGMALRVDGYQVPFDFTGAVYLGGERKVAWLEASSGILPHLPAPERFERQTYLRLYLTTPGLFRAGWRPEWLVPGEWGPIPDTPYRVRLRAACVPTWQPVSGYDYQARRPKPMRKLAPAGALYLVEVDPVASRSVAEAIWGSSLCDDPRSRLDGYGIAAVGLAHNAVRL